MHRITRINGRVEWGAIESTALSRLRGSMKSLLQIVRWVIDTCLAIPLSIFVTVLLFIGVFIPALPFLLWARALDRGVRRLIPELVEHESVLRADDVSSEFRRNGWALNEDKLFVAMLVLSVAWLGAVRYRAGYETMVMWVYPLIWAVATVNMLLATVPLLIRRRLRSWVLNELCRRGVPICTTCGYSTRGILGWRCPECGTAVIHHPSNSETLATDNRIK